MVARRSHRLDPDGMAREMCRGIGREVMLSRTNLGLSVRSAARLAGIAPRTFHNVEHGNPNVGISTVCQAASAMGLRVWGRTFPSAEPTLRDTGQLWIAEWLRATAHPSWSVAVELGLGNLRSVDMAFFGPTEILATEIERLLADYQAQRRVWIEKRDALAEAHQRPVRLILAIQDTAHNRAVVRAHAEIFAASFPAGSREVLASLRSGRPLGSDGIVWVRRREHPIASSADAY